MKLLAYLKVTIMSAIKDLHIVLLFCIFPIALGLGMATMEKGAFIKENKTPFIEVNINDEDNSNMSKAFLDFINGEDIKKIVLVKKDVNKKTMLLTVPKGYEENITNKRNVEINIKVGDDTPTASEKILKTIIEKYNDSLVQGVFIEKNIDKKGLTEEEKKKLYSDLREEFSKIEVYSSIKDESINVKRQLSSYEYFSVTMISYLLFILLMGLVQGNYVEMEAGITRRIKASPITPLQNFNYGFASGLIYVTAILGIYVTTYRVLGLSFKGSIPLLALIIIISSIFIVSISSFFTITIGKKYFTPFITAVMIIQMILGGTFIQLKEVTSNEFVRSLGKFSPDVFITRSYNGYVLNNNLSSIYNSLLALVGISIVIYIISITIVNYKESIK